MIAAAVHVAALMVLALSVVATLSSLGDSARRLRDWFDR